MSSLNKSVRKAPFQSPIMDLTTMYRVDSSSRSDDDNLADDDLACIKAYCPYMPCSWRVSGEVEIYNRNQNYWVCREKVFRGPIGLAFKDPERVVMRGDHFNYYCLDDLSIDFLLLMTMSDKIPDFRSLNGGNYPQNKQNVWLEKIPGPRIRVRLDSNRKLFQLDLLLQALYEENKALYLAFLELTGVKLDNEVLVALACNIMVEFRYVNLKLCPAGRGFGKTEFYINFSLVGGNVSYNGEPLMFSFYEGIDINALCSFMHSEQHMATEFELDFSSPEIENSKPYLGTVDLLLESYDTFERVKNEEEQERILKERGPVAYAFEGLALFRSKFDSQ